MTYVPNIPSVSYLIPGLKEKKLHFPLSRGLPLLVTIEDRVCTYFNINPTLLHKKCRKREIVMPRQIIVYLGRQYTSLSLKKIGEYFNQDHTTAIHCVETIKDLLDCDEEIKTAITHLKTIL